MGAEGYAYVFILFMTLVAFVASFIMLTVNLSEGKFWVDSDGSLRCPAYWCNGGSSNVDAFEREWDIKIVLTVYHAVLSALTLSIMISAVSVLRRRRKKRQKDAERDNGATADAEAVIEGGNPLPEEVAAETEPKTTTKCFLAFAQHFFVPFGCLGGAIGNGFVLEPPLQSTDESGYLISLYAFVFLFVLNLLPCCFKKCQLTVN